MLDLIEVPSYTHSEYCSVHVLNLIKVPNYTHGEWPQREEAMSDSYTYGELCLI